VNLDAPSLAAPVGRDLLAARMAAVPMELERFVDDAATSAVCEAAAARLREATRVVTTGAGASEGPARILAAELHAAGRAARFETLSSFLGATRRRGLEPASTHLVVFSQGMCPNVRAALRHAHDFRHLNLVTSVSPEPAGLPGTPPRIAADLAARGATLLRHGPVDERGLLVRIVGPAVATLAALRLAGLASPDDLPLRQRAAFAHARRSLEGKLGSHADATLAEQRLALVTVGGTDRHVHGLRWKLLEACGLADPPVWDVLQFAHGPFQQIVDRPLLLCALERPDDAGIVARLEQLLVPERHLLLRARATLPPPWSFFEHDAYVNAVTLELLGTRDVMVGAWPGQGADGPLYDFDGTDD